MDFLTDLLRGSFGVAVMIGICYTLSANRKAIDWKLVIGGIFLQVILAVLILQVDFIYNIFNFIADGFVDLLSYAEKGATFVFGSWAGDPWMVEGINPGADPGTRQTLDFTTGEAKIDIYKVGYMFAFKVLPTVVFFSAFSAMLFYFGIMQKVIYAFAWLMSKFMKLSGAESMAAAANVFIGQTEAPLVIKPYLEKMTKSEIMSLMTGGFATIAGGVFALFVALLGDEFAIHFLTASIISAPAAIVVAKILYPQTGEEEVNTDLSVPQEKLGNNVLDAISMGTTDGVRLAVNVGAMLLVFIAMIAFVNGILGWGAGFVGGNEFVSNMTGGLYKTFNLEFILGILFAPIAWILGVPSQDILVVGQLLGLKTAANEVLAYVDLSKIQASSEYVLHPKSLIIATYALCGFANFSSIGIQIGGISAIAPGQRENLTELGLKAMIGGTIACFITAAIAGILIN